jgi:azurin
MKAEIDVSSNDKLRLNDKDNRTAFSCSKFEDTEQVVAK